MRRTSQWFLILVLTLGLFLPAAVPAPAQAAAPTELFFSEYIEGSSFNKALEIYNGTGAAIDLAAGGYNVLMSFNGGTSTFTINLTGSVAAGDVYVVAPTNATDATILAQADQSVGTSWFNGDDAIVLRKGTAVVVDSFGQLGIDPGTEWAGGGLDDTLRRKASVCSGDTNPNDAFSAATEWDTFANNTFDDLGAHTANCGDGLSLVINDVSANEGDSGTTSFDFTVSLSGPAGPGGVTFDIATADGTATAGDDYGANSLTGQTISAGSSSYTFSVLVNGDAMYEANETFFVNVTSVTGATEGDVQGQGTIVNDDVLLTRIHDIQGSGPAVTGSGPFTVEAIVVGDFQAQGSGELRGFFLQEEDADVDADAATSEGIFVFCSSCPTAVSVGDKVRVTGGASEFFNMSQLSATTAASVSVLSSTNPLPAPATIDLPASESYRAQTTFENVEGMLVRFIDTLYVSEYFELARYGQLVLTAGARPPQFTDAYEPSVDGYAVFLADLNSKRIILDDDNNIQNDAVEPQSGPDEPYYWPRPGLSNTNFIRGGDSIAGLTGVMHWSFAGQSGTDAWRVRPVEPAFSYNFTSNNARTLFPEDVSGSLKVASFNVLNYFTTINSRGADSLAELDRQRSKTAAAICAMDADVVGLIEIENNGAIALADLLNGAGGINTVCGPYAYIDTGAQGTDEIFQAFIYRTSAVNPVGDFAVLDSFVDPRFDEDFNRPALAQTFQDTETGGIVTVVVNHLKSKGSACPADPDVLDGQGNCNITRTQAAAAMVDWLATDPTGSGDDDFLIIGDLNSYRNEDPIDAIEAGADDVAGTADDYTDLLNLLIGPSAYSYVFDGQLGYLDHALAGIGLADEVSGVTVWHINADEIPVFDYNDEIDDGSAESSFERESNALPIYEPNAYRSSDHDPVIVGLAVCDEIAPTFDELSVTPDVLWPANHKYVDVTATVSVSDDFDPSPAVTLVSVTSNEPDDGEDDGDMINDIVIVDDFHFKLRAERSGMGTGRIYTITYMVTDACGNSTTQSVTVTVPLSKGN